MCKLLLLVSFLFACASTGRAWFTRHYSPVQNNYEYKYAECQLVSGVARGVSGTIRMRQAIGDIHPLYSNLEVEVSVTGLNAGDQFKSHGLHVHTYGDTSDECKAAGGHFNPFNTDHGAPTNPPGTRHVGDWGNAPEQDGGTILYKFTDYLSSLTGAYSIYGRSIVLHRMPDDLGKGGDTESLANGKSGARLACCVIRLVKGDA